MENSPQSRYCSSCGTLLESSDAEAQLAEHEVRKTFTVLFADITSSTCLGECIDAKSM